MRTINEVYELLNKKREYALRDLDKTKKDLLQSIDYIEFNKAREKKDHLIGEIQAYTDIIILLETSGLIKPNNEEAFKELFLK